MKRIGFILLSVLILSFVLIVPAFAADSGSFEFYWNQVQMYPHFGVGELANEAVFCYEGQLSDGQYYVTVKFYSDGVPCFLDFGMLDVSFVYDEVNGIFFCELPSTISLYVDDALYEVSDGGVVLLIDESVTYAVCIFNGDGFDMSYGMSMSFAPVSDSPIDSVSGALDNVIAWVGMVLDSFMEGPLAPLLLMLAIPIAVTALVFSIKAIMKNSWGV